MLQKGPNLGPKHKLSDCVHIHVSLYSCVKFINFFQIYQYYETSLVRKSSPIISYTCNMPDKAFFGGLVSICMVRVVRLSLKGWYVVDAVHIVESWCVYMDKEAKVEGRSLLLVVSPGVFLLVDPWGEGFLMALVILLVFPHTFVSKPIRTAWPTTERSGWRAVQMPMPGSMPVHLGVGKNKLRAMAWRTSM